MAYLERRTLHVGRGGSNAVAQDGSEGIGLYLWNDPGSLRDEERRRHSPGLDIGTVKGAGFAIGRAWILLGQLYYDSMLYDSYAIYIMPSPQIPSQHLV